MKITVEFDSLEEISEFQKIYVAGNNIIEEFVDDAVRKHLKAEPKKEEKPKKEPKKEKAPEPVKEEAPELPETKQEKQKIDEAAIRILLAEKIKAGKKPQVKELFTEYGVEKLTELTSAHPDKLDEIYAKAEAL
jgi:hypothetical protein